MGRTGGFLGGLVLTSSIMYLAATNIRRQRDLQSQTLRECRTTMDSLLQPAPVKRNPAPYTHRPTLIETMKDTWNREVVGMVRWLQDLDMVRIRENTEGAVENVVEKLRR